MSAPSYAEHDGHGNVVPDSPPPPTASLALHPRVAVLLGVDRRWLGPLLACRALSMAPAIWWGLRCALTFLAELVLADGDGYGDGGRTAAWAVEKRFRVTEVFMSILWVCDVDPVQGIDSLG